MQSFFPQLLHGPMGGKEQQMSSLSAGMGHTNNGTVVTQQFLLILHHTTLTLRFSDTINDTRHDDSSKYCATPPHRVISLNRLCYNLNIAISKLHVPSLTVTIEIVLLTVLSFL